MRRRARLLALENGRLVAQMVTSERLATIGALAAGVAHEINNPLAYVSAAQTDLRAGLEQLKQLGALFDSGVGVEQLRERWAQLGGTAAVDDLVECVGDAAEGATRIRDIAMDLRALSRTEEGVQPVATNLAEVIRSALRVSATEVKGKAQVVQNLDPDLEVMANGGRLSQVFINLVVNAAQAMNKPHGKIALTSRREGARVKVEVADDGPGIRPEHSSRLVEAFFTTKRAGSGTGLGLWLSREIVRGYGGELTVTTVVGEGTAFVIDLPVAG